ncbi:hypothetical protein EDC01DRAFT_634575 [Geopyxis carbonaria]|nr:hypothetical protein EDC01DRAFT_634575 [Geopyxis carbonaria]
MPPLRVADLLWREEVAQRQALNAGALSLAAKLEMKRAQEATLLAINKEGEVARDRALLISDRARLDAAQTNAGAERASLDADRQQLEIQRNHLGTERANVARDRKVLTDQRAILCAERAQIAKDLRGLASERSSVCAARAAIAAERKHLDAERQNLDHKRERLLVCQREIEVAVAEMGLNDDCDALRVQTRQNALWLAREIDKIRVLNDKLADLLVLPAAEAGPSDPLEDVDPRVFEETVLEFQIKPEKTSTQEQFDPAQLFEDTNRVAHCARRTTQPSRKPQSSERRAERSVRRKRSISADLKRVRAKGSISRQEPTARHRRGYDGTDARRRMQRTT